MPPPRFFSLRESSSFSELSSTPKSTPFDFVLPYRKKSAANENAIQITTTIDIASDILGNDCNNRTVNSVYLPFQNFT